ncbi:unnamed protein product [Owenia fusiformis]|uniref:Tyrosine-protein kinase receptor n=1 Tax=Owenia fusiformis TaxID=6347 RepID=A0A8S4NT35_OWEFU|nr:unnamed protein product [Owenia fusiformis]
MIFIRMLTSSLILTLHGYGVQGGFEWHNVAAFKPVTSEPLNATCGDQSKKETPSFCTRTSGCEICLADCPHGTDNEVPLHNDIIGVLARDQPDFFKDVPSDKCAIGSPNSSPCITLVEDKFCQIKNDTFPELYNEIEDLAYGLTVYIKPVDYTFSGTDYRTLVTLSGTVEGSVSSEVLHLGINKSGALYLVHLGRSIPVSNSLVKDEWTFVAIQVYRNHVSLFLNGIHVIYDNKATYGNVTLHHFSVGKSEAGDEVFHGGIQQLRIYGKTPTNKDIATFANNKWRPSNTTMCRCPEAFPEEWDASGSQYCRTNNFIIQRGSYVRRDTVSYATWISQIYVTFQNNSIDIGIDLEQSVEVQHIELSTYSGLFMDLLPLRSLVVEKRTTPGIGPWQTWQYYSKSCLQDFNIKPDQPLQTDTDVICKDLSKTSYSRSIRFELIDQERAGNDTSKLTESLATFIRAGEIRVHMALASEFLNITAEIKQIVGILEFKVIARCFCNGYGDTCNTTQTPYVCSCTSISNRTGLQCEKCKFGFYMKNNSCIPCPSCNVAGVVKTETCDRVTGQCPCKANFEGLLCDQCKNKGCSCPSNLQGVNCDSCKPGYFNFTNDNPNGCEACNCDPHGSVNSGSGVYECDASTGYCPCLANAHGAKCTKCDDGYYWDDGCKPCQCHTPGTIAQSRICNVTRQCLCKRHVSGMRCDSCDDMHWKLSLSNADGCQPCNHCYNKGTVQHRGMSRCHKTTGQCECEEAGAMDRAGYYCRPYVTSIVPLYGPVAGGTNITISGAHFGSENATVNIGGKACLVFNMTAIELHCTSQEFDSSGKIGENDEFPQELVITLADGITLPNNHTNFTYKGNPDIEGFWPRELFESGGSNVTVRGNNLDSVHQVIMKIIMVYKGEETVFEQLCTVVNSDLLECPSPKIVIPDDIRNDNSTGNKSVNSDNVNFFFGFTFDGFAKYDNASEALGENGTAEIFQNPTIERYTSVEEFYPGQNKLIYIWGKNLLPASNIGDYKVILGDGILCKNVIIDTTGDFLTCEPPVKLHSKDADVRVQVEAPVRFFNTETNSSFVGFLRYMVDVGTTDKTNPTTIVAISVGSSVGLIVLLILLLVGLACRYKVNQKRKALYTDSNGSQGAISVTIWNILGEQLSEEVKLAQIDEKRLDVFSISLGEGYFGRVFRGMLYDDRRQKREDVAVKTIKERGADSTESIRNFIKEAIIMREFDHVNVLSLLGIVVKDDGHAMIVLPIMSNGDLKKFISSPEQRFTVGALIGFGLQVARGMAYLELKRFQHGDLSAKNCMVDQNWIVKIADFGLAHDLYTDDYYRPEDGSKPQPFRWLAIESIIESKYTIKSDVWSFGVVFWEILTRGCTPYSYIGNGELKNFLLSGGRLDRPAYSPDELWVLISGCWQEDPQRRPSFSAIVSSIERLLTAAGIPDNVSISSGTTERGGTDGYLVDYLRLKTEAKNGKRSKRSTNVNRQRGFDNPTPSDSASYPVDARSYMNDQMLANQGFNPIDSTRKRDDHIQDYQAGPTSNGNDLMLDNSANYKLDDRFHRNNPSQAKQVRYAPDTRASGKDTSQHDLRRIHRSNQADAFKSRTNPTLAANQQMEMGYLNPVIHSSRVN